MSENLRWCVHPSHGPYAEGLDRNQANHAPLTPLSFLIRTAAVYPERIAVAHGRIRRTYRELLERSLRLASALERRGIAPGDTVRWVQLSGFHSIAAYHPSNDNHELRIPVSAKPWDSGVLLAEDPTRAATFEHVFTVQGVYDYFCKPHERAGMVGRIVVGDPGDGPGLCYADVTCDAPEPDCPPGTAPGIANGCFTGYCIPLDDCESQVACGEITVEMTCIARPDCTPLYEGVDCTCDSTGCDCASWKFSSCGE